MLREDQIHRYARQILLPEIGGGGQARLLAGRVRVVGDGRAAVEAATYLAAAGVGVLVLEVALAARVGERLARMNPYSRVARADGSRGLTLTSRLASATEIAPAPADDRLAGALAARQALMRLTGAREGFSWAPSPAVPGADPRP